MGEVFRRCAVVMAAFNLVLAMLLVEKGDLLLFVCLGCAVAGWMTTRNRDAWMWP